jgi:hypothetical protein
MQDRTIQIRFVHLTRHFTRFWFYDDYDDRFTTIDDFSVLQFLNPIINAERINFKFYHFYDVLSLLLNASSIIDAVDFGSFNPSGVWKRKDAIVDGNNIGKKIQKCLRDLGGVDRQ